MCFGVVCEHNLNVSIHLLLALGLSEVYSFNSLPLEVKVCMCLILGGKY